MFVNFVPIYMLLVQDKWPGLKVHVSITTIKHSGKYSMTLDGLLHVPSIVNFFAQPTCKRDWNGVRRGLIEGYV